MFTARKYESGEYLNITNITRDQAGDYECAAENDISSPDTKTVKVTVNCEYHIHFYFYLLTVGCHGIACKCSISLFSLPHWRFKLNSKTYCCVLSTA